MKIKTFVECNKTINIILDDNDCVIIEKYDYEQGYEQFSVDLRYYEYDFNNVIDLYKIGELFI